LLLRPGVTVSKRELLDSVWGDEPPGTGADVVPSYVFRLRKSVGDPDGAVLHHDRRRRGRHFAPPKPTWMSTAWPN